MNAKEIRRNLYKVFRKTGIPREVIDEKASLKEDLFMDDVDMTCFLFYLETRFNVEVKNEELPKLNSVGSTINFLQQHCA
ncbi:acyl carrier protein [Thermophagus xiamenensis]|uniref:Acyl carrier protein n=1 Tax=Thermophagus xiamenensis TaxID=385682 RepID=A0A1I2DC64_9BACT|nr:acyl carrier protein [Thermophagus xiamenensis]SFE77743.1 acyl carrier protein [Thermophagus xiamenensis]